MQLSGDSLGRGGLAGVRRSTNAASYLSYALDRASNAFHNPATALSAGWRGGRRELRARIVGTPSTMILLSGKLSQIGVETTKDRRPWGKISRHEDPASS